MRYELIDGVACLMTPAQLRIHQDVVGEMFRQVANALLNSACRAYVAPFDVRLPKSNEADDRVDTLVHPGDRVVTINRLTGAAYGRRAVVEMTAQLTVSGVPGVSINWEPVLARLV